MRYPETKKSDTVETLHGEQVPDPYRWLEDLDSDDTAAWVKAQNAVTMPYLQALPLRETLTKRLTHLWNYERYGLPMREGGRYFFRKNDGLQNQSVLYVADALDGPARVLLDPNTLSTDGTVSLQTFSISRDGTKMAYALSSGGSDWLTWHVRDVTTGKDLPDTLQWSKFSGASWLNDGSGFFYSRYDEPAPGAVMEQANYFQKLCFHRLGTEQSQDPVIYERKDEKEWGFNGHVTDDGRYLIISVWRGTDPKNLVFYKELGKPDVVELIGSFDAQFSFLDNEGPVFIFQTDLDAPRGRIIAIDTRSPARPSWKERVAEHEDTLEGASIVGERLFLNYLHHAQSVVRVHRPDGAFVEELKLPGIGSAGGFGGRRDETETFYAFTSYTTPSTIYRLDVTAGAQTVFKRPSVDVDPTQFETRQVFFTSKDGTRIPMFISHKKGLALDGKNPTYLYGYGGFNISLTPAFSVSAICFMEQGGIYAVANLRGGGEYGEQWHRAGTREKKQNVFDDFIAAAEWLIRERYTSAKHLGIGGGSNGGLLVGACMAQRPELFRAAIPEVGVMDMLRFHKFTIGWAWTDDYGRADDGKDFAVLRKYSPLHNLKKGTAYPATLIMTADHDDRVVPAHSFKFAAALQEAHSGDAPVLIRIEERAGHGAGTPTNKLIQMEADKWSFLLHVLR